MLADVQLAALLLLVTATLLTLASLAAARGARAPRSPMEAERLLGVRVRSVRAPLNGEATGAPRID